MPTQPLLCTSNPSLCIYIQDGILLGLYGDAIVGNMTLLPTGSWTHVGLRYEAQCKFFLGLCCVINSSPHYNLMP